MHFVKREEAQYAEKELDVAKPDAQVLEMGIFRYPSTMSSEKPTVTMHSLRDCKTFGAVTQLDQRWYGISHSDNVTLVQ